MIREFREDDWGPFHALISDPSLVERREELSAEDAARKRIQEVVSAQESPSRCSYELAICMAESGEFIGEADLGFMPGGNEAEIGIVLSRTVRGAGLGTETCRALIDLAWGTFGIRRVVGYCDRVNAPSRRMMEKAGMHLEDERKVYDERQQRWRDACIYAFERG
ncbi:MAG: GNAT family N-acetyltransferase [Candidatus Coatesbacteria bacterium]